MNTQNFLTTVRLMTYTMILSLFAFSAGVYASGDGMHISGGGDESESTKQVEGIELEQWMLEQENFTIESKGPNNISESHPLENWMIEGNFELKENSGQEKIQLEDWMLERSNFTLTDNNQFESWMMNRRCFITKEKRIFGTIKNWMTDHDFFRI